MTLPNLFLSAKEIKELTDIRGGYRGKTREQLQIAALRKMKVPHHVTPAGRPKVPRAVVEFGSSASRQFTPSTWEPRV